MSNSKINLNELLKSSIISKSNTKINGDELICNYPYLINKEKNIEFNNQINQMLKFRYSISDDQFGYYLAGLIEGDGHCSEKEIAITYNILDTNLACYIQNRLNLGHIYKCSGDYIKFTIRKKEEIIKILTLVNGKFYSNYKIEYMLRHNYENRFGIKLLPPIDNNKFSIISNYFLAGFADADSCFYISNPENNSFSSRFIIKQKDTTIINFLKSNIGGNLSLNNSDSCSKYEAAALNVIIKYEEYFDKFPLLSTKYINYILWKKALLIKKENKHLTQQGKKEILELKNSMNSKLYLNFFKLI